MFTSNNKELNDLAGQVQWSGRQKSITEAKVLSITVIVNHMGEMQMDIGIEGIEEF